MLAAGLAARRFCRRLRLPPYGIRVRAIDRNSRQVYSAGSLPVERLVYRASRPHAKVATSTQRLTGHTFSRSAVAVSKATKGRKDTAQPKACTPNNKGNGVDVVDLLTLVEDFGRP